MSLDYIPNNDPDNSYNLNVAGATVMAYAFQAIGLPLTQYQINDPLISGPDGIDPIRRIPYQMTEEVAIQCANRIDESISQQPEVLEAVAEKCRNYGLSLDTNSEFLDWMKEFGEFLRTSGGYTVI